MKKYPLFLISVALFWGMIKILQKTRENIELFTHREQEILDLIALGYNDNEIAGLLHMSERRVQQYESNISRKTNAHDISNAIQYALEKGLLRIDYA
jgi:DNA-binding NarL/FixJ family response regulator